MSLRFNHSHVPVSLQERSDVDSVPNDPDDYALLDEDAVPEAGEEVEVVAEVVANGGQPEVTDSKEAEDSKKEEDPKEDRKTEEEKTEDLKDEDRTKEDGDKAREDETEEDEEGARGPSTNLEERMEALARDGLLESMDAWNLRSSTASNDTFRLWLSDGFYQFIVDRACDSALDEANVLCFEDARYRRYIRDLAPPSQNVSAMARVSSIRICIFVIFRLRLLAHSRRKKEGEKK